MRWATHLHRIVAIESHENRFMLLITKVESATVAQQTIANKPTKWGMIFYGYIEAFFGSVNKSSK